MAGRLHLHKQHRLESTAFWPPHPLASTPATLMHAPRPCTFCSTSLHRQRCVESVLIQDRRRRSSRLGNCQGAIFSWLRKLSSRHEGAQGPLRQFHSFGPFLPAHFRVVRPMVKLCAAALPARLPQAQHRCTVPARWDERKLTLFPLRLVPLYSAHLMRRPLRSVNLLQHFAQASHESGRAAALIPQMS